MYIIYVYIYMLKACNKSNSLSIHLRYSADLIGAMVITNVPVNQINEKTHITGWWYTYPTETYESQLG